MQILVAGVRQRKAPIAVRERFALTEAEVAEAMRRLVAEPVIGECIVLTTCNRTEIYVAVDKTDVGMDTIKRFFREFKGVDVEVYRQAVFTLLHEDAVLHLLRVASGLDSLILGEAQILGQVKDSLARAQKAGTSGRILDRLFNTAIAVGKRVRTETGIASKDVSVSRAAYDLARRIEPDFADKRIALIGGGKMATILMGTLKQDLSPAQQRRITIVNRSESRLNDLIAKYGYRGVGWDDVDTVLAEAEVLFIATGAPHVVLSRKQFESLGPKLILDISVPRNVDPAVGELPHIRLYNTDDLEGLNTFTPESQQAMMDQAQAIMAEEYVRFHHWYASLPVVPTITGLRTKVEEMRRAQLAALGDVSEHDAARLDRMSRRLVNKMLHEPIVRLRSGHRGEIVIKAEVLSDLFNINETP